MSVEIKNGKVYVNGTETVNPELIGYAVLDLADDNEALLSIEVTGVIKLDN